MCLAQFFLVQLFTGVIVDTFVQKRRLAEEQARNVFITPAQKEWLDIHRKLRRTLRPALVRRTSTGRWGRFRLACERVVRDARFDRAVNCIIVVNVAVMSAYNTDMSAADKAALDRTNLGLNTFFMVELGLRITAEGTDHFSEAVNWFDGTVVVFSFLADIFIATSHSSVLRALRTIRLTRLFYSTVAFHVLFDVFFRSLPILLNILGLTSLVFFMYAVLGMNLFGTVNAEQDTLNRQANFSSFGISMLTLLRVATGDDWTNIMHEAMVQPPDCSRENPNGNFGCGPGKLAYAYFLSFNVVGQFIMLNLFVAVLLEQYAEERKRPPHLVRKEDVEDFFQTWLVRGGGQRLAQPDCTATCTPLRPRV